MLKLSLTLCSDKIHQGGGVAAPIASQVLGEVLPYLEISKDNENEEDIINKVLVPDLKGCTISDAKNILKDINLSLEYSGDGLEDAVITDQIPVTGVEVFEGSTIIAK